MNAIVDIPQWERERRDWPNGEASRVVRAAGMSWHVQEFGSGPVLLLLHGTGASTHSWRDVAPLLAKRFNVIAIDAPGHGFTQMPGRELLSIYGMGRAIRALLQVIGRSPALVVGHSAGAAVAVRMCLDGWITPHAIIGLNAALLPLSGAAGHLFSPLTRILTHIPIVPKLFAWHAVDRGAIKRMIDSTGSTLDAKGIGYYHRLAQRPSHVAAALAMMAEWDLPRLRRELPRLRTPLFLIVGSGDRTIPPSEAKQVQALVPGTEVIVMRGLGHLAHEEAPEPTVREIQRIAARFGLTDSAGGSDA